MTHVCARARDYAGGLRVAFVSLTRNFLPRRLINCSAQRSGKSSNARLIQRLRRPLTRTTSSRSSAANASRTTGSATGAGSGAFANSQRTPRFRDFRSWVSSLKRAR